MTSISCSLRKGGNHPSILTVTSTGWLGESVTRRVCGTRRSSFGLGGRPTFFPEGNRRFSGAIAHGSKS